MATTPVAMKPTTGQLDRLSVAMAKMTLGEQSTGKGKQKRLVEDVEECITARYGDPYKLEGWQLLCNDIGIQDTPPSITKCKKALGARKTMINIVNLVDHIKHGVEVMQFDTWSKFLTYTKKGRSFPRSRAKEAGFIHTLLRRVAV